MQYVERDGEVRGGQIFGDRVGVDSMNLIEGYSLNSTPNFLSE